MAAAASDRRMPSLTVVFSSDTDICFSPGVYGDCLPTVATDGAPDSFRAEWGLPPFMLAHPVQERGRRIRHIDTMDIVHRT
ncbi:hypothetical protein GCM10010275_28560 [Streptomyces litmocidini]|nr:hypothetical protein GCM10010275_28560 [Streptomyces litmocidini]